jgi:hypothetical protein
MSDDEQAPLDEAEKQLMASEAIMSALWNGSMVVEMLNWLALYETEYKTSLVDRLTALEPALRKFIELRDQGLAEGGWWSAATADDVERVRELTALVTRWRAGGEFPPEIYALSGDVLTAMRRGEVKPPVR